MFSPGAGPGAPAPKSPARSIADAGASAARIPPASGSRRRSRSPPRREPPAWRTEPRPSHRDGQTCPAGRRSPRRRRLEPGDGGLKAGIPTLAVVPQRLQPLGEDGPLLRYRLPELLVLPGSETVVPAGVKVVAVPPIIQEVRHPIPTDKPRLFPEDLSVEAAAAPGGGALPLPGAVGVLRKPQLRRAELLHREAGDPVPEEGQETIFLHGGDQILRRAQFSFHVRPPIPQASP